MKRPPQEKTAAGPRTDPRKDRLKAALKANIARRKAQAAARRGAGAIRQGETRSDSEE